MLKRILIGTVLSFACLLLAIYFGGRWYLADSAMPLDGQVALEGLSEPVEVLFDGRGIPRIYARSDADAIRALGWVHASERLFQMELLRRVARGELAALIGAGGLDSDREHRRLGFARRASEEAPTLDGASVALIDAYVAGINARIASGRDLPPGFLLMSIEPEPWTRADVLMLAYYQTWYPATLVQRLAEAWRAAAAQHGPEASEWLETLPSWGVSSVPAQRMTEASNTWVVSPERSTTGAALHASDPHLDYTMAPGLWYAVGLHSQQSLDVVGVSAPGLPFIAMGHNGQIAFGFTVAPVDLFELYRFERDPDDPNRLLGPDGPIELRERIETFSIRGEDQALSETFRSTRYGPVVSSDDRGVEVLHWAGFELPLDRLIRNGLAVNRAQDFEQFRAAATDLGALSVNWSYSDKAGNIGYVQSTPIPLRQHEHFYQTLDGAEPDNFWAGFVPPEQRPYAFNPEQGWLANANNHAAMGTDLPMPGFYKHLRMRRAVDWLTSKDRFSPEDMRRMQLDRTSERAIRWTPWLSDIARRAGHADLAAELEAWDGVMDAESTTAGLFALWWQHLPRHLFDGGSLADWRHGRTLMDDWLALPPEAFELNALERDEAARRALEDALSAGIQPLGDIQSLTIRHPLAVSGPLDAWLDLTRGPLPIGGDAGSLNVAYVAFDEAGQRIVARAGPSMRFVMDWSDPDAFTLNLTLGQSGHPLSPHFDDQLDDFMAGRPWRVPFSRQQVEAGAASRLRLVP